MNWSHDGEYGDMRLEAVWGIDGKIDFSIKDVLKAAGIEFVSKGTADRCMRDFFDFLGYWHNNKWIKPKEKKQCQTNTTK